jgi:hypothetical protein
MNTNIKNSLQGINGLFKKVTEMPAFRKRMGKEIIRMTKRIEELELQIGQDDEAPGIVPRKSVDGTIEDYAGLGVVGHSPTPLVRKKVH